METQQPFFGLLPSKGDRVRATFGREEMQSGIMRERTVVGFVCGDPQVDDEKRWFVPVAGHGSIPAGLVKTI